MPFTFSHPAAVLPLTYLPKRWYSLTALVIGSIVPDFEYFMRMRVYSIYSHTWAGLFWFDLPLAIILTFVFHLVVRDRLIEALPHFLKSGLSTFHQFQWTPYFKKNFVVVIISSIIGAATHLLWDSFTHQHGQFVQSIGALRQTISVAGNTIPVYKILQHTSSILGALIIIYALLQLPSDKRLKKRTFDFTYWLAVTLVASAVIVVRLLSGLDYHLIGNVITTGISCTLIGLIMTPIILKKNRCG